MKNSELDAFLAQGMKKYKKASEVMVSFYENMKTRMQQILISRENWGIFDRGEVKNVKSTKFWDQYPFVNAQISGKIEGKPATIKIGINWYASDSGYPFYGIWFYDIAKDGYKEKLGSFQNHGNIVLNKTRDGLNLNPNPDDFNLERDFTLLLDAFIELISK
jgi:hypothetical protein